MDAALLRSFRRGDPDALEAVYRLHVGEVEIWVRRGLLRLGRLNASDLADLVQDIFMRAFSDSARASYDGLREYVPFLMTLARNLFIDWARRAGREIPGSDFLEGHLERGDQPAADASEGAPFEPSLVALANAYVEGLPEELRRVHHQRFVLATPQRQAAEALGISRQSLRTLEKKLIVGLRRQLRQAGVDPQPLAARKSNPDAGDARSNPGRPTGA
jgi:RNA polymerase sigma-70 factor (ECF subfamily)